MSNLSGTSITIKKGSAVGWSTSSIDPSLWGRAGNSKPLKPACMVMPSRLSDHVHFISTGQWIKPIDISYIPDADVQMAMYGKRGKRVKV